MGLLEIKEPNMHLIQILLPLKRQDGQPFGSQMFDTVRHQLAEAFGGITFYRNAPAEGNWVSGAEMERDQIVVAEVMTENLDQLWWRVYRHELECVFGQQEIVIRALPIKRL